MIIGSRIKKIRELKGIKQSFVAYKLGITQQAYSKFELVAGDKTVNSIIRIAEILEVDVCLIFANHIPINQSTIHLKFEIPDSGEIS
jgi:transcriptional regulator with XRE-family HTH domain